MFHAFQDFQKEVHFFTLFPSESINFLYKFHILQLAALGCLFLAGKVEETPKKCKDLCGAAVKAYPHLQQRYRNLVVGKYLSFSISHSSLQLKLWKKERNIKKERGNRVVFLTVSKHEIVPF